MLSIRPSELGASSVSDDIRDIIPRASIKQAMEMQAEAEHSKREDILQSEGDQQSEINLARGWQQDFDNAEQQLSAQDPIG